MRSFLILLGSIFAKIRIWRKVAFLGGAAKNWFVIIQNANGKSEPILFCSYFVNEFTNPRSARQVVQSSRSLFVELR